MLDVVLPLLIALCGALLAAIPYAIERRSAGGAKKGAAVPRPPPTLRMAAVFFLAWGLRDVIYGCITSPPFVPRVAAGVTALAAGAAVLRSTFPGARKGTAVAALVMGIAHVILTIVDVVLSR